MTARVAPEKGRIPSFTGRQGIHLDLHYRDPVFIRGLVVHEFGHALDIALGARFGLRRDWAGISAPGGDAGWQLIGRNDGGTVLSSGAPGFVSRYAQTSSEEDRAETLRAPMTQPGKLHVIADEDPIVARKAALMVRFLTAVCPGIDDRFWNEVRARETSKTSVPAVP
jgi:hypothetical protein